MLAYYTKRSLGEEFEKLPRPLKSDMWVDGSDLSIEELNHVVKTYDLAANIVYDLRDRQELPRLEFSDQDAYVFLRAPRLANSGRVVTSPMLCIVRPNLFFTLSQHETFSPENVAQTTLPLSTDHTADLLLGVMAACIGSYQELLKHTERSINDTGARLRTHEVTNQDFIHFVVVEDNLTTYRMNLAGILTVAQRLKDTKRPLINKRATEALDDISLQIQQLLAAVESYRGRVESIRNAYSTVANNTLNLRIKTLTVFTVLITVPNVFYGMFGMNVDLPFEKEPWAYAAVVGFTAVLTLIVYVVAKRLKLF